MEVDETEGAREARGPGDDMPLRRVWGAVLAQHDDAYICHGWMTGAVGLVPLLGPIL